MDAPGENGRRRDERGEGIATVMTDWIVSLFRGINIPTVVMFTAFLLVKVGAYIPLAVSVTGAHTARSIMYDILRRDVNRPPGWDLAATCWTRSILCAMLAAFISFAPGAPGVLSALYLCPPELESFWPTLVLAITIDEILAFVVLAIKLALVPVLVGARRDKVLGTIEGVSALCRTLPVVMCWLTYFHGGPPFVGKIVDYDDALLLAAYACYQFRAVSAILRVLRVVWNQTGSAVLSHLFIFSRRISILCVCAAALRKARFPRGHCRRRNVLPDMHGNLYGPDQAGLRARFLRVLCRSVAGAVQHVPHMPGGGQGGHPEAGLSPRRTRYGHRDILSSERREVMSSVPNEFAERADRFERERERTFMDKEEDISWVLSDWPVPREACTDEECACAFLRIALGGVIVYCNGGDPEVMHEFMQEAAPPGEDELAWLLGLTHAVHDEMRGSMLFRFRAREALDVVRIFAKEAAADVSKHHLYAIARETGEDECVIRYAPAMQRGSRFLGAIREFSRVNEIPEETFALSTFFSCVDETPCGAGFEIVLSAPGEVDELRETFLNRAFCALHDLPLDGDGPVTVHMKRE